MIKIAYDGRERELRWKKRDNRGHVKITKKYKIIVVIYIKKK